MKLSAPDTMTPQPQVFSWTNLWNIFYGSSLGSHLWQQAQTWIQPVIAWAAGQEEIPFYMQAQSDEKYLRYQAWRQAFRQESRYWFQTIVALHRQGASVSLQAFWDNLLAQQATFEPATVSPLYYGQRLKRLAQRLPQYAPVLEGAAAQLREHLKTQPTEALNYFYNELINHLIDGSRYDLAIPAVDKAFAFLPALLAYYHDLVPEALWQETQAIMVNAQTQALQAANPDEVSPKLYQTVLKQLNALFGPAMKVESAAALPAKDPGAWEVAKESLRAGWHYLKAHPQTALWGVAGTVLGANTSYQWSQGSLAQTGISWLESVQPTMALSASLANFPLFPVVSTYLSLQYTQRQGTGMPEWPAAIPLASSWLTSLLPVAAQVPERWAKILGGAGNDLGEAVQQTVDGGYIVAGSTRSFGAGSYDLLLTKWAANGTLAWAKTLGGMSDDIVRSMRQTADGGYILTGETASFGAGDYDLWLTKWAANGTLAWAKTLGGDSYDSGESVQQTADGGYIVAGYTGSFYGVGGGGGYDLWLTKWTADGILSWAKILDRADNSDYGNAVQQTADGGYIVTGTTYSGGDTELWLTKWAADGTLTWAKTLGGASHDGGESVQQTVDGGYIVTGYTQSFGAGLKDLWLTKWAADGTLTWAKTLGGMDIDHGNAVQQTTDGGYIVTGYTESFGAGSYDLWLSKWAANGTLTWAKALGGANADIGYSVQQTADGGYIVSGITANFGEGGDLWLLKWDSQGTIGNGACELPLNVTSTAISPTSMALSLTPNTLAVTPQNVVASAQAINPLVQTICNEAPSLTNSGGSFIYTEKAAATVIDNTIVASDADNPSLSSASIWISSGFASGQDELGFIDQAGIVGNYNSVTGILSLTGSTSVANYQAALRSITYRNTSNNPSTAQRTFTYTVNDGLTDSNAITRYAIVEAVNDAPVLSSTTGGSIDYTEQSAPIPIDNGILISDVDSANLANATVAITANFQVGDQLGFTQQAGIGGSYNSLNGLLRLMGNRPLSDYQTLLSEVTYFSNATTLSTAPRTIVFSVSDGLAMSNGLTRTVSITPAPIITTGTATTASASATTAASTTSTTVPTTMASTTASNSVTTASTTANALSTTDSVLTTSTTGTTGTTASVTTASTTTDITTAVLTSTTTGMPALTTAGPNDEPDNPLVIALSAGIAGIGLTFCMGFIAYTMWKKNQAKQSSQTTPNLIELDESLENKPQPGLSSTRTEKGHTTIGGKYALINKITQEEARALLLQEGISVTFPQGQYKQRFVLGQGQFGKLRLAQIVKTGQYVGVKKIKTSEAIAASKNEARLQAILNGKPNIMPLLDAVETLSSNNEPVLYQFMPLAGFGNGEIAMQALAQFDNAIAEQPYLIHIARGLLVGLSCMHAAHIYHLDMKPANYVIGTKGDVDIIDFGCAVESYTGLIDLANGDSRYYPPERLANCRYHAPAYQHNREAVEKVANYSGAKADSWAVGVTLLELCLKAYPFEFCGFQEKLAYWNTAYFEQKLAEIPILQQPAADSLYAVIKGLLAPNPAHRLTVEEALNMLVFLQPENVLGKDSQAQAFSLLSAQLKDKINQPMQTQPQEPAKDAQYAALYFSTREEQVKPRHRKHDVKYSEVSRPTLFGPPVPTSRFNETALAPALADRRPKPHYNN